ncbi:hypothetical protein C8F01DRAFT_1271363 [Mycena amicta]|nr:hypothetical protein C8F01DRAFT_1271363 [Mycena amicta]
MWWYSSDQPPATTMNHVSTPSATTSTKVGANRLEFGGCWAHVLLRKGGGQFAGSEGARERGIEWEYRMVVVVVVDSDVGVGTVAGHWPVRAKGRRREERVEEHITQDSTHRGPLLHHDGFESCTPGLYPSHASSSWSLDGSITPVSFDGTADSVADSVAGGGRAAGG